MTRSAAEIFHEAREMPAEQREGYLVGACGKDLALRTKVEALLEADAEAGGFMASPTAGGTASSAGAPSHEQAGASIDRYKLLEQIGEGGMGTIWMAEQREPVKRRVALKIIKLGMDTKQVIARFEAERQALAMMDHPNIAKVFDAGATEAGRPYFVMEYIKGIPILEYCDQAKLDTEARLELFASICHAIQHAHQKGIIHRDIKPDNVLVTLHDGVPVVKVIDFGIAKATNSELTQKTLFTEHRQMIGTPAYMSPEQAEMSGLDIDTRSDIYSLGVLLYELLTGTTPFDMKDLLSRGFGEMMRAIREDEPHKPSTRISSLGDTGTRTALQRRVDAKQLSSLLRGDLDWIVMKCLEKDRSRRYETANGLAADIVRHLKDEPVTAGAPTAGYRLRKFAKRNRRAVLAASIILFALLTGIVGSSWGLVQKNRARSIDLQARLEREQHEAVENARLGRNAEAVAALLGQCEDALRVGDAAKAGVALEAARKRSAEGGAEADALRLERLSAELALSVELDEIDQLRWTMVGKRFAEPRLVASRTRAALSRFGADPETVSIEDAAARTSAAVIEERIVSALDRLLRQGRQAGDRHLLRRVDADTYRNAIRDAVFDGDRAALLALVSQDEVLTQPTAFAAALAENEVIPVERRRELLEAAVLRRPAEVGLLMSLGTISAATSSDRRDSAVEGTRWYQAAIAADPDNVAAINDLAVALLHTGRSDAATPYFRRALELDPQLANAHSNWGTQLSSVGRWDEAIEHYQKATELDPTSPQAHSNLALALRANGRLDEAVESAERAIAVASESPLGHQALGFLLFDRGQPEEALSAFRTAAELDPGSVEARVKLGYALQQAGQLDEAETCLRGAVELAPQSFDARVMLGLLLRAKGEIDEAIACTRGALELDPRNVTALVQLGAILCDDKQDFDGAIACFARVRELDPSNAQAAGNLGLALCSSGELDEGIARIREAIELDPQLAWAHYSLAGALLLSSIGQDELAAPLDPRERADLLRQALYSLQQALELFAEQVQSGRSDDREIVEQALTAWQQDPELATVRDPAELTDLSAELQAGYVQLWADAAALLKQLDLTPPETTVADRTAPAFTFLRENFESQEARLGPDHRDTLDAMLRLAAAYQDAEQFDLAVPLLEQQSERASAAFGLEDQMTQVGMERLAVAYFQTGRLDKSIPLFEQLLQLYEAMRGRDHPTTLKLLVDLGVNYREAGRHAEAIALLEEVQRAPDRPPQLEGSVIELLGAYAHLDPAAAAERLAALIPTLREEFGDDHFFVLLAMNNHGYFLARSRQFAEAEALLDDTIERELRFAGEGHWLLLQTRTNLGELYLMSGRTAEAEALLRRCLAERENQTPPNSFNASVTRSMLGRALSEGGKFAEAERLLLAGYAELSVDANSAPAWGSHYLPDTKSWLVELYDDWGKPEDAMLWRAKQQAFEAQAARDAASAAEGE